MRRKRLPKAIVFLLGLIGLGVAVAACKGSEPSTGGGVIITPIRATLTVAPVVVTPGGPLPTAPAANGSALSGFAFPMVGACLPKGDQLMPNAVRAYREGIHEGVDFYEVDNCTRITRGTEVLAAKAGRVVRADLNFIEMAPAELSFYLANPNTEDALDHFRGRQVWIQHDGGIVTRYAHLNAIAPGVAAGTTLARGQVIGFVGESGTPETVTNPGFEYHLHFEVRVGSSFLGQGQSAPEVRRLYTVLFSP